MKNYIVQILKWALSKFEPKPTLKEMLAAWPFPEEAPKVKPAVKKTRPLPSRATRIKQAVGKKATTVAKKTTKKAK